jgi:hypothetical protein
MDGQETRPRGREKVLASAAEEPETRRAPGKPVRGPAHDPDRGEAASSRDESSDDSNDDSNDDSADPSDAAVDSSEADFLGKEEQEEDNSERDSSQEDDSKKTMPPPDDNFSSGLF